MLGIPSYSVLAVGNSRQLSRSICSQAQLPYKGDWHQDVVTLQTAIQWQITGKGEHLLTCFACQTCCFIAHLENLPACAACGPQAPQPGRCASWANVIDCCRSHVFLFCFFLTISSLFYNLLFKSGGKPVQLFLARGSLFQPFLAFYSDPKIVWHFLQGWVKLVFLQVFNMSASCKKVETQGICVIAILAIFNICWGMMASLAVGFFFRS